MGMPKQCHGREGIVSAPDFGIALVVRRIKSAAVHTAS
jgi:hypothetical protein